MTSFHIWTIGCQMNKADSAQLSASLVSLGYKPTNAIEDADLIVINSCVVRQSAEDRVLSKLGALSALKKKLPNSIMALAGCMVNSDTSGLRHRFPHIDLFLKPGAPAELLELAREQASRHTEEALPPLQTPTTFVTVI